MRGSSLEQEADLSCYRSTDSHEGEYFSAHGLVEHSSKSSPWDPAVPGGCCRARCSSAGNTSTHQSLFSSQKWEGKGELGTERGGGRDEAREASNQSKSVQLAHPPGELLSVWTMQADPTSVFMNLGQAQLKPCLGRPLSPETPRKGARTKSRIIHKERAKEGASQTHLWQVTRKATT